MKIHTLLARNGAGLCSRWVAEAKVGGFVVPDDASSLQASTSPFEGSRQVKIDYGWVSPCYTYGGIKTCLQDETDLALKHYFPHCPKRIYVKFV